MTPPKSSGTIPSASRKPRTSVRNTRSTRALSASADTPNPDDVPAPVGPSGTRATPQLPLTPHRVSRTGNENLETMDEACDRHTQPFNERVKGIEDSLPGLRLAIEDSIARLAQVEQSGAKIDQVTQIQHSLGELNTTISSFKDVVESVKTTLIPNVTQLRSEVNNLMEESSITRRAAEDQSVEDANSGLRLTDTLLKGLTQKEPPATGAVQNPVSKVARHPVNKTVHIGSSHTRNTKTPSRSKRNLPKPSPRSGVSRRQIDDNQSTSEDSNDEYVDHRRYEQDYVFLPVPFYKRTKGPKHPGLCSLEVTDKRYDDLVSYCFYRLRLTT